MSRRLFQVASFSALVGILSTGYLLKAPSEAIAIPAAAKTVTSGPSANPMGAGEPAVRSHPFLSQGSARPPVPLQPSRHATYWDEDPQQPVAPATQADAAAQKGNSETSGSSAKAMIEADGYKGVKSLVRMPDGTWRGVALRGAVEVAISVDPNGNVSAQ